MNDFIEGDVAGVLHANKANLLVDKQKIEELFHQESYLKSGKARYCAHQLKSDQLQDMLIVHTKECYVRPHRHLNRPESLHIIAGSAFLYFFDDNGAVLSEHCLGDYQSGKQFFVRIGIGTFHSIVIESEQLIFHESTLGPFDLKINEFARWAPDGSDQKAVEEFLALKTHETKKLIGK